VVNNGIPVGVIEVKKAPTENHENPIEDDYIYGQIYDYMRRLETFYGLSEVFGIITNYSTWKLCWLNDPQIPNKINRINVNDTNTNTNTDMSQEIKIVRIKKEKKKGSFYPDSPPAEDSRRFYGTKLIEWNDERLIRYLISLIFRMYRSPRKPPKLFDKDRHYVQLSKDHWSWVKFHSSVTNLDYKHFPSSNANSFILLEDFRGGVDGRVWLACSTSGKICIIKFFNGNWDEEAISKEKAVWKKLWNFEVQIKLLLKKHALLMPYVKILTKAEISMNEKYETATKAAIDLMVNNNYFHGDLDWRHVGFWKNKVKDNNGKWKSILQAIFIDLIGLKIIEEKDKNYYKSQMYRKLELTYKGMEKNIDVNQGSGSPSKLAQTKQYI
jgi:hypothetical protein